MIKRISILILICTFSNLYAQKIIKFEPSILECQYYKTVDRDTANRGKDIISDYVSLRIGKTTSMFYGPKELNWDSLSCNKELKFQFYIERVQKDILPAGRFKERIYKNYPTNELTVYDHFALMHWTYSEEWEKPQWTLIDSVKSILGHSCQLAKSLYRNRIWYAWFTLDIPINDGPWKLCGLPGLILEAYDPHKEYTFTAVAIQSKNIADVGIYDYSEYDWAKTSRIKFLRTKFKELHTDRGAIMSQMYNLKRSTIPQKLKHINYDFEETDYH